MHHFIVHRLCTSLASGLAAACLLCASPVLQAADLSPQGRAGRAPQRNDLPLQFSFSLARPLDKRIPQPATDDTALAEECEEEDDIAPVISIPHGPPVHAAPTNQSAPANAPFLGKLEPVPQATENRATPPRPQEPTPAIAAARPAKVNSPPPTPPAEPGVPVASQAPAKPDIVWEIALADKTLSATLARWAGTAGWQLVWELPFDYTVEARTAVPGTFEEAVEAVAKSMESANTAMQAIFYKGNKVLRIVAKGSE
jgi:hypothetical protein